MTVPPMVYAMWESIRFRMALDWLWPIEGGWYAGNEARDPNPTNFGIIQSVYDAWRDFLRQPRQSVRKITRDEAAEIYWHWYWLKAGCQGLTWPLALVHFDAAVNHGTGNAAKLIRRANGDWRQYIAARRDFYAAIIRHNPAMKPNERGWARRMNLLEEFCRKQEAVEGESPGG